MVVVVVLECGRLVVVMVVGTLNWAGAAFTVGLVDQFQVLDVAVQLAEDFLHVAGNFLAALFVSLLIDRFLWRLLQGTSKVWQKRG